MVKPKGVWLQTTELTEAKEAQVVKLPAASALSTAQTHGRGRKPLLIGALALCCCVLLALVGLHVYPDLLTAQPQAHEAVGVEDSAKPDILEPSYGVLISADGEDNIIVCRRVTVAEALRQAGVVLGEEDEVSLPLDTLIEDNCAIKVSRLYSRVEIETVEIPPIRQRVDDATLASGATKVLEEGEAGLLEKTFNVSYRDGEEIGRELISGNVLKEPGVTKVAQGVALASRAGESSPPVAEAGSEPSTISVSGEELSYTRKLSVESTAYTWTGNTTATGTWPAKGTVAVDPRVIPLGSRLYVEGYGFATATDTGGAIKGNIIDVYFSSYDECIKWGRKRGLTVYILE